MYNLQVAFTYMCISIVLANCMLRNENYDKADELFQWIQAQGS